MIKFFKFSNRQFIWCPFLDEKGAGWIRLIIIFVVGSLALTYAFNPVAREEINDFFSEFSTSGLFSNAKTPTEIKENPNKYLGETVTVQGYYIKTRITEINPSNANIRNNSMEIIQKSIIVSLPEDANVYSGGKYNFTGVVKEITNFSTIELVVENIEPI